EHTRLDLERALGVDRAVAGSKKTRRRLWPAIVPPPRLLPEDVTGTLFWNEGGGLTVYRPADLGIAHRSAEEVARGSVRRERVARDQRRLIGGHIDLELRCAGFLDPTPSPERDRSARHGSIRANGEVARRRVPGDVRLPAEGAVLGDRQLLGGERLPPRVGYGQVDRGPLGGRLQLAELSKSNDP